MKKAFIIFAVLTVMAAPAYAGGPIMVKDWYNECTANTKETVGYMKQLTCLRYARGLADGVELWHLLDPNSARICIPKQVDAQQLVEVGKKYYRENPRDQHTEAAVLLGLAFQDAWPCQATPSVNFK